MHLLDYKCMSNGVQSGIMVFYVPVKIPSLILRPSVLGWWCGVMGFSSPVWFYLHQGCQVQFWDSEVA